MVHARIAGKARYDPGGPSSRENYEHNETTAQARTREGREKKNSKNYTETFIHSLSSILSDQINPSNLFLVKLNPLFSIY